MDVTIDSKLFIAPDVDISSLEDIETIADLYKTDQKRVNNPIDFPVMKDAIRYLLATGEYKGHRLNEKYLTAGQNRGHLEVNEHSGSILGWVKTPAQVVWIDKSAMGVDNIKDKSNYGMQFSRDLLEVLKVYAMGPKKE